MDHRLGRVPSTFCYEAWFPARSQPFTASELHHIQTQLYRSFIFRGQCCGKLVLGLKPLHSRHKKGSKSLIVIKS